MKYILLIFFFIFQQLLSDVAVYIGVNWKCDYDADADADANAAWQTQTRGRAIAYKRHSLYTVICIKRRQP